MPVLYAAAPEVIPPPPEPVKDITPISHVWEAWDGFTWDLTTGISGVYLRAGVRGLTMPPVIRYTQKSPAVAGSLYRGSTVDEREVFWPVKVYEDEGSQSWIDHNRRWWRTLLPNVTGDWVVTQPGGETRRLTLRYVDDGQFAWGAEDPDPEIMGYANYGITLVAERPFWTGVPRQVTWVGTTPVDFLDPPGSTDVIYISANSSVFGAQIENPGSVDAWPTWVIYGPCTDVNVGVGTRLVNMPIDLTSGQWVRIETDPTSQTAVNHAGTDVTGLLGTADFAPVPPGAPSPLSVEMTGTGTVIASIIPNYYTATSV
jgi:hypothetical protein